MIISPARDFPGYTPTKRKSLQILYVVEKSERERNCRQRGTKWQEEISTHLEPTPPSESVEYTTHPEVKTEDEDVYNLERSKPHLRNHSALAPNKPSLIMARTRIEPATTQCPSLGDDQWHCQWFAEKLIQSPRTSPFPTSRFSTLVAYSTMGSSTSAQSTNRSSLAWCILRSTSNLCLCLTR